MDGTNLDGFLNVSELSRRTGYCRAWVRKAMGRLGITPIRFAGPSGRSTNTLLSPKDAGRVIRYLERKRKRATRAAS